MLLNFRVVYLITKRNFKPPGLQHRKRWSENFHEFLKFALQKEPKKRPVAAELLKVWITTIYESTFTKKVELHAVS